MFSSDFIFSVTRDFVGRCRIPTLLMPGDDTMHPITVSADLQHLTGAEVIAPWKGPAYRDMAIERTRDFLLAHTPEAGS